MNDLMSNNTLAAEDAKQVLFFLNDSSTMLEIKTIREVYESFIYVTKYLECHSTNSVKSIGLIDQLYLHISEGYKDNIVSKNIFEKFTYVLNTNTGLQAAKKMIQENIPTLNFINMTPYERNLVANGPGTSSDVEWSFSVYK